MSIKRDTLSLLWATSFGICSFPGCNQELICMDTNDIIGHVCHIVARKPEGPRGNPFYTSEQLDQFDNLLLLCPTHHAIVDRDIDKYTIEVLKDMKALHYARMKESLQDGQPWNINVSQFYYLNIPRLATLPTNNLTMLNMDILGDNKCLHNMGFELSYVLQQYQKVLNQLDICAQPLTSHWGHFNVGQIVSFSDKFRTKNVPGLDDYHPSSFRLKGDLDNDPILYLKRDNRKFVLTIDPRWLTTSTSFVNFKLGWVDVAGLAVIKYSSKGMMVASPYMLGTPKNCFWDFIFQ